jgi:hypothetical protein
MSNNPKSSIRYSNMGVDVDGVESIYQSNTFQENAKRF